jgi:hypothetical protein
MADSSPGNIGKAFNSAFCSTSALLHHARYTNRFRKWNLTRGIGATHACCTTFGETCGHLHVHDAESTTYRMSCA